MNADHRLKLSDSRLDAVISNGIPIFSLEEVDSTFLEAERMIKDGLTGAALICAKSQSRGRGRFTRSWASPPGNLYWTMVLPKGKDWPRDHGLTFSAGLATIDAFEKAGIRPERASLKWPNDVLVDGKKASGAMVIASSVSRVDGLHEFVMVGIGVNVLSYPQDAFYPATCLVDSGVGPCSVELLRDLLTAAFLNRLSQWRTGGFGCMWQEYSGRLFGVNQMARVGTNPDRTNIVEGVNRGIDCTGALIIESSAGEICLLQSADVLPPLSNSDV